jgi:hypothetical protein
MAVRAVKPNVTAMSAESVEEDKACSRWILTS